MPLELRARPLAPLNAGLALSILYLGLGATAVAWYLWNKGLEYVDASVVAVSFFAQPVVRSRPQGDTEKHRAAEGRGGRVFIPQRSLEGPGLPRPLPLRVTLRLPGASPFESYCA